MTKVKVLDPSTQHGIYLDDTQTKMFIDELNRVMQHLVDPEDLLARIGEDAVITVIEDSGVAKRYHLFGRAILQDEETSQVTQFYMGLQLLEWLH